LGIREFEGFGELTVSARVSALEIHLIFECAALNGAKLHFRFASAFEHEALNGAKLHFRFASAFEHEALNL
jgi:hypothetical protein